MSTTEHSPLTWTPTEIILREACQNALITAKIMQLPRLDSRVASNEEMLKILIAGLQAALAEAEKEVQK